MTLADTGRVNGAAEDLCPHKDDFSAVYESGAPQLVYRRVINDLDTPVSAYIKIAKGRPYAFLYESVQGGEQRGRYSFLGFSPDIVFRCTGLACEIARGQDAISSDNYTPLEGAPLDNLRSLEHESRLPLPDGLPPMAAGLFGYLGYDMVRHVEDIGAAGPDPIGTPDCIMIRPTVIAIFDLIAQEIILATPVRPSDKTAKEVYAEAKDKLEAICSDLQTPINAGPVTQGQSSKVIAKAGQSLGAFSKRVEKAKDYIRAGDVFQVVIGQRFCADLPVSPFALYRSLRRLNPSPFLFFLNFKDHAVIGSSPEILVRRRGDVVTVRPIAGTRPRGATQQQDAQLEAELLADKKECAEHLMLLDLGRNDAGRVSLPGTVKVTESFTVERYSHVMHIVSNVEARLDPAFDTLDALFAGFPAGTVSGAPKIRAMQIIDELEDEKRGIYAGAVGYISCQGDMDTAIALRTAIVKDGVMHVRAGAGIVLDSNPKAEYEETQHKAQALFTAASHASRFDGNAL
ncbi:anthranilate synthase component I [Robiginitomaculum antarcticum]|uniref:anthranilate synthase component I n=1 Tax=Robiginitomaculum antarcticum TaxID=437507 RepID=UPI000380916F|nr:anthranilate synthase component I [Robiginitomaculum antarcticum]